MPYIKKEDRVVIDDHMKRLEQVVQTPGELNYAISSLCSGILEHRRATKGRWGYTDINEIIGALECAKLELYRRIAHIYEDVKIAENGDVYGNVFPSTRDDKS